MKQIVMVLTLTLAMIVAYKLEAKMQTIGGSFNGVMFRIKKIMYDITGAQNKECIFTFGPMISDYSIIECGSSSFQHIYHITHYTPYMRCPIGWTYKTPDKGNFLIPAFYASRDVQLSPSPPCLYPAARLVISIDSKKIQFEDTLIQLILVNCQEKDVLCVDMELTLL